MNIKLTKTERLLLCGGLIGMASLMLQACETVMKENEDEREKICGNWESAEGKPDILVYREGTLYKVTLFRRSGVRRRLKPETYLLEREENGNLYMNTGFRIDVAYNEETDVLTFSPNGDYIRVDTDDTSDGEKKKNIKMYHSIQRENEMKRKLKMPLIAVCLCLMGTGRAHAQWVVSDPGNLAQSIINSAKEMVETAGTKANTLNGFLETKKVFEQGKAYYDALKSVHDVVKGGAKVAKSISLVMEISGNLCGQLPEDALGRELHFGGACRHLVGLCDAD